MIIQDNIPWGVYEPLHYWQDGLIVIGTICVVGIIYYIVRKNLL